MQVGFNLILIHFMWICSDCDFFSQVVVAVSWPIPYKNPLRKLFFNIGFQFNYGEPFNLSSFYNATYFQNPFTNRKMNTENESTADLNGSTEKNVATSESIDDFHASARSTASNDLIGSDVTAGELYEGIEQNLFESVET